MQYDIDNFARTCLANKTKLTVKRRVDYSNLVDFNKALEKDFNRFHHWLLPKVEYLARILMLVDCFSKYETFTLVPKNCGRDPSILHQTHYQILGNTSGYY